MVILLLEGGQRFLWKIEEAVESGDPRLTDHFIKKFLAIVEELHRRLNHDEGGGLVDNLIRLYDWWRREVIDACEQGDASRLKTVASQMTEIRKAWEHVLFRGEGLTENPEF
jgi:flagellar biosynthetic protein FliS